MAEVIIKDTEKRISCETGDNLLQVLLEAGVFVDNPCSGKGLCGKCRVRIVKGELPPPCETEQKLLKQDALEKGIRLSCLVEICGDLEVELLQKERKHTVLTKGYVPDFDRDVFDETGGSPYGVAIDIGTTTVVTALVDMRTGEEISNASMINAQKHYGLDVLTRITYEYEHQEQGIETLKNAIINSVNAMIEEVCREARGKDIPVHRTDIGTICVAANCTMLHMLLGVDARSIGKAPYRPVFLEAQTLSAADAGIKVQEGAVLYCLPSVSGYIGADIVAGAYVCGMQKEKGNVLFIDIGTNGELVLAGKGRILCCSCAAGPALEGMNISYGMRAAQGAVEEIAITKEGVRLCTIGGEAPAGFCGSGILSVVKELLRVKLLKRTGAFIKKETLAEEDYRYPLLQMDGTKREFCVQGLVVTQGDVRQVQLAKGAILSGITVLLEKAQITVEELDQVKIAGQFGAHLPAESLTGSGIVPKEAEGKLEYVGNSSKTGAYMALLSRKAREEMEELAGRMEYMELAETENYERIFAECMRF